MCRTASMKSISIRLQCTSSETSSTPTQTNQVLRPRASKLSLNSCNNSNVDWFHAKWTQSIMKYASSSSFVSGLDPHLIACPALLRTPISNLLTIQNPSPAPFYLHCLPCSYIGLGDINQSINQSMLYAINPFLNCFCLSLCPAFWVLNWVIITV